MKIKSGNYDILYSGTFIQVTGEPVEMTFSDKNTNLLVFMFKFIDDKNIKGQVTNFNLLTKHSLEITFINFNDSLGIANTEILELGTLNNRKLFLNYRIYSLQNLGKTVHYTFYQGEEVVNGKI